MFPVVLLMDASCWMLSHLRAIAAEAYSIFSELFQAPCGNFRTNMEVALPVLRLGFAD
jgi:hypothetical protein